MIKVLFIHSCLVCGGAEQALYDLCVLMDKSKFDISVLVLYDGGIWEQKFRNAGIKVFSIWDCQKISRNPVVKIQNLVKRKQIEKSLKNHGQGLINVCFSKKFDLIVSYQVWSMHPMCFVANTKTIEYIHGDVNTNIDYKEGMLNSLEYQKKYDRIISVSETARQSFMELTGITKNVSAHFNPLNSDKVRELSQIEIPRISNQPMICAVGRLTQEKGFERLVRIHKRIVNDGIKHTLIIIGDGSEKENISRVIHELGVENSVVMAGYQSNPYPYMKQSDFVVCPSYTEGLSVIGMEALALGVPVVSAVPTIGELFGDEVCGVVTENDDASLESGIRKMLTEREFYLRAKDGAEKRSKFFNGKRMVKEIEEEFINLVNS